LENGKFKLTTNKGTEHVAPVIMIAGGLGCFEPRKPPISNITDFEDKGVEYIIRDPEFYRNKRIVVAGGGDSALDWSIYLTDVASNVVLIHRRTEFRGAPDSVRKVQELVNSGRIELLTEAEVIGLAGNGYLEGVVVQTPAGNVERSTDHFIPLFGLSPKLGPIADWGLNITKNAIAVNTLDYSTNVEGIYAIGDINEYPNKLKLILCGFHEATLAVHSAYKRINPGKNLVLKYTTVNGVQGF
jgi:thioredoxin reductase (NADPH)